VLPVFVEVGLCAIGEKDPPGFLEIGARLVEAGRGAGRVFPWMAARIEATAPGSRIDVGWIAGADRDRSDAHVTVIDVPASRGSFDRRRVRAGMPPLKRQPLTRTYNRFAPLLRLYIDLASGIPIASQFSPKWLRVQISDFPALSARPRIGISKPTEDNGMSAGEVKQYLVEHAKSHGVLTFRGNRARRVQTLLPALGPFHCQAVPGGGGGFGSSSQ
jgi:hypothetical protein